MSDLQSELDKAKKLVATTVALPNQFLYDHPAFVDSMPLNGDFFGRSPVSQNILSSILYRVETASILRRSDKHVDVVLHGSAEFVVGNIG